jgi:hypothetical protein
MELQTSNRLPIHTLIFLKDGYEIFSDTKNKYLITESINNSGYSVVFINSDDCLERKSWIPDIAIDIVLDKDPDYIKKICQALPELLEKEKNFINKVKLEQINFIESCPNLKPTITFNENFFEEFGHSIFSDDPYFARNPTNTISNPESIKWSIDFTYILGKTYGRLLFPLSITIFWELDKVFTFNFPIGTLVEYPIQMINTNKIQPIFISAERAVNYEQFTKKLNDKNDVCSVI